MDWNVFWDSFPLVFFNGDYAILLLLNWAGAIATGFVLIYLSKRDPGIKKFVYFVTGIVSLVSMFRASTAGIQLLPVFLSVAFLRLTTAYFLVVVTEWRLVTWKEAWDLIFPWVYKWFEEKENKEVRPSGKTEVLLENYDSLSFFEKVKLGYRFRFGKEEDGSDKPKTLLPKRLDVGYKKAWKIQLWFLLGVIVWFVLWGHWLGGG
jgi:hypothetical protein